MAAGAVTYSAHAPPSTLRPVLVNGTAGVAVFDLHGEQVGLLAFTVARGKIVEINILAGRERLGPLLDDPARVGSAVGRSWHSRDEL